MAHRRLRSNLRALFPFEKKANKAISRRRESITRQENLFPKVWSYRGLKTGDRLSFKNLRGDESTYTVEYFSSDDTGKTSYVTVSTYGVDATKETRTLPVDLINIRKRTVRSRMPGYSYGADSLPAHALSGTLSGAPLFAAALLFAPAQFAEFSRGSVIAAPAERASYTLTVRDASEVAPASNAAILSPNRAWLTEEGVRTTRTVNELTVEPSTNAEHFTVIEVGQSYSDGSFGNVDESDRSE